MPVNYQPGFGSAFVQGLAGSNIGDYLLQLLAQKRMMDMQNEAADSLVKASYNTTYPTAQAPQRPTQENPFGLAGTVGPAQQTPVSLNDPQYMSALLRFANVNPNAARMQVGLQEAGQPQFIQKEIPRGGSLTTFRSVPGQAPQAVGTIQGQPINIPWRKLSERTGPDNHKYVTAFDPMTGATGEVDTGEVTQKPTSGQADFNGDLSTLTQADKNVIKAINEYRFPLPASFALKTPYWQKIVAGVTTQDPTFDAAQYPTRQALRRDFTVGKSANNIRSLNTVAQHLDKLEQTADALGNGNVNAVNAAINFFKKQTGNQGVTNFESAANAVANEAVTVFKNTGATDQEINHVRNIVGVASSPAQLKGYIKTVMDLVNGRINALKSQYEEGMKKPLDFQMLDKTTRDVFQKHGISPADIEQKTATPQVDTDPMGIR